MELSNILELIHAVSDSNLTEFNLQDGNLNISMSTEKTIVQQVAASADTASFAAGYQPTVQPTLQAAAQNQKDTDRADDTQKLTGNIVKSPLVGTYYAASSPDSAPFVKVGDKVSKGQVLGIVEAMKLMNEIKSEQAGKVVQICVKNGDPIEFGQVLMYVE